MKKQSANVSARDLVLDAAERHFASRGYAAVTLKDIAKDLGIRQASLYYHVPGGKEDLFVEVMLRYLERHQQALERVIEDGSPELEACLTRAATWMLTQPPLNLSRMTHTDLPDLAPEKARCLEQAVGRCIITPVERLFALPMHQQQLRDFEPRFLAGMFLTLADSLHTAKRYRSEPQEQLIANVIDVLLRGVLKP